MDREIGEAKQLVAFDPSGSLVVNEDVLQSCFLAEDVKDRPLCLISIIGEERKGKSFLLNYLLRRLHNLEQKGQQWLGADDEDLTGFEWKSGADSTTKGVFIWSKAFLMETEQGKMAIFVVDSEGCNEVGQDPAVIVRLSTLSMLLSSYLIFNVSTKVKQTDLEQLEIFLNSAQQTGEALGLDPIQHVDVVVRDWFGSIYCGEKGGKQHLQNVLQKVQRSQVIFSPVMDHILARARCFLMPFPGKSIAVSSRGHVKDMDTDFRDCLVDYFGCVLKSLPSCARKDSKGSVMSGSKFFGQLKLFIKTIEQYTLKISTPLEMASLLWNTNSQNLIIQDFDNILKQQEHDSDGLFKCVKTRPSQMRKLLEVKEKELIEKFGNSVRGRLEERERAMDKLQSRLHREKEIFCRKHSNNFTKGVITLGTGAIGAVGGLVAASVLVPGTAVAVVVEGAGAALGLGTRSGVCMVLAAVGAGAGVWAGLRARVNTVMKRA